MRTCLEKLTCVALFSLVSTWEALSGKESCRGCPSNRGLNRGEKKLWEFGTTRAQGLFLTGTVVEET